MWGKSPNQEIEVICILIGLTGNIFILRASRLMLEFRYYKAKIEESEKAGSHQESNPGHLWLEPPVPTWGKMLWAFRVRKPLSKRFFPDRENFYGRPPARCVTEAFSTICAVHIEDCGGWWLSSCRNSVAEHWLHKPGVLGLTPSD